MRDRERCLEEVLPSPAWFLSQFRGLTSLSVVRLDFERGSCCCDERDRERVSERERERETKRERERERERGRLHIYT